MATPQLPPSKGFGKAKIPAQTTGSRLLQLPPEVFLLIVQELSLHARYFISQTCRPIRQIAHQDWAEILQGNSVSHHERMRFYTELAYHLPDKVVCLRCARLHKVNVGDTPSRGHNRPPGECPYPNFNRYDWWMGYSLSYNHVQLALKYTRLKGAYTDYLARLAPVSFNTRHSSRDDFVEFCTKVPGIRAGRFILQTIIEYSLTNTTGLASRMIIERDLGTSMLCKHISVQTVLDNMCVWGEGNADHLLKTLESLATRDADLRYSCCRCRTDMLAQFRRGLWTFRSWQDFGSETEAGIGASDILLSQFQWGLWGGCDVGHLQRPKIPHVHGSLEKLWNSETPLSSSAASSPSA